MIERELDIGKLEELPRGRIEALVDALFRREHDADRHLALARQRDAVGETGNFGDPREQLDVDPDVPASSDGRGRVVVGVRDAAGHTGRPDRRATPTDSDRDVRAERGTGTRAAERELAAALGNRARDRGGFVGKEWWLGARDRELRERDACRQQRSQHYLPGISDDSQRDSLPVGGAGGLVGGRGESGLASYSRAICSS